MTWSVITLSHVYSRLYVAISILENHTETQENSLFRN